MYFGPHETSHSWEFEWFYPANTEKEEDRYVSLSKIGLCGLPIPKQTCIIANLFLGHEPLILSKDPERRLQRGDKKDKYIDTRHSGIEEVSRLVDFLKQHKEYHFFMSTTGLKNEIGIPIPNIATFSNHAPLENQYKKESHIKIEFEGRKYGPALEYLFRDFPFRRR